MKQSTAKKQSGVSDIEQRIILSHAHRNGGDIEKSGQIFFSMSRQMRRNLIRKFTKVAEKRAKSNG